MPWEKQFDVEAALTSAMQVFWCQGYEATSMQNLVEGMGINPGSIYATFGNKRSLFLKSLQHYEDSFLKWFDECTAEHSPRDAILAVFEKITRDALEDPSYCGCLMVNTSLELAPHDEEIARVVAGGLDKTEEFFRRMIKKGQATGEIGGEIDAVEAGRVLLGLLTGLRVLSRGRPKRAILTAVVRHAAAVLT